MLAADFLSMRAFVSILQKAGRKMQRYFVATEQFSGDQVVLAGDDAHHAIRVMRMKEGDQFICSDGAGCEAIVQVVGLNKQSVIAKVIETLTPSAEPDVKVWIAQSLPKGDKMETVIQKGTEIGASKFIPFLSSRGVVKYDSDKEQKRLIRWGKIAKEAAEQAHRNMIPQVEPPCSWEQMLKRAEEVDLALLCYEQEGALQFKTYLSLLQADRKRAGLGGATILLMIGPEGGFDEQEVLAAEQWGWKPVSLGRRILRTETAALVGLSCILYEFGEMGE